MKLATLKNNTVTKRDPDRWKLRARYAETQMQWDGSAILAALECLKTGRVDDARFILEGRLSVLLTGLGKIEAEDREERNALGQ